MTNCDRYCAVIVKHRHYIELESTITELADAIGVPRDVVLTTVKRLWQESESTSINVLPGTATPGSS